jgi:hypothetical protein
MDGDPAVEHQLDSFSLTFPLPYRIAFIVILGTLHMRDDNMIHREARIF